MTHATFTGSQIWCPYCQDYKQFLKTSNAATLADVTRRTIYRYIEEGKIYAVKTAGKTYRVCGGCLLRSESED